LLDPQFAGTLTATATYKTITANATGAYGRNVPRPNWVKKIK